MLLSTPCTTDQFKVHHYNDPSKTLVWILHFNVDISTKSHIYEFGFATLHFLRRDFQLDIIGWGNRFRVLLDW